MEERAGSRHTVLRLLGGWRLAGDGLEEGLGHREQRLTALLGLVGEQTRHHVAGLLWPDSTDERALASLRRAVMTTQRRCPGLLSVSRSTVALAPDVEVDVADVRRAAAELPLPVTGADKNRLLSLLGGDLLLPGWYDEWVLVEREALQQLRLQGLERLARSALSMGDLDLALDGARAMSGMEPFRESACEVAVAAHLAREEPGSALHEFHRYRLALWEELGVPPSPRILSLVEPALDGDGVPDPVSVPTPRVPSAAERLPTSPEPTTASHTEGRRSAVSVPAALLVLLVATSVFLAVFGGGGPSPAPGEAEGTSAPGAAGEGPAGDALPPPRWTRAPTPPPPSRTAAPADRRPGAGRPAPTRESTDRQGEVAPASPGVSQAAASTSTSPPPSLTPTTPPGAPTTQTTPAQPPTQTTPTQTTPTQTTPTQTTPQPPRRTDNAARPRDPGVQAPPPVG